MTCRCADPFELEGNEAEAYADAHLRTVAVDAVAWTKSFVCDETGRRWIMDFPQSEQHGGGAPRLRPITPLPPDDPWRRAMVLFLDVLGSVVDDLPPVGQRSFEVATRIWRDGEEPEHALQEERTACGAYLRAKHGTTTRIADDEDRALRALLCVLQEPGESSISDNVEWFEQMLGGRVDLQRLARMPPA